MKYYYNDEERQQMKDKIAKFKLENSHGSTTPEQIEANEWRIKQLEFMLKRLASSNTPYVRLNPVEETFKDPKFTCATNLILGK